jgi:hypothetical protein
MPVNKKLMAQLFKLDGAVADEQDPFAHIIESPSPSFNYTFDNTWGLPDGYGLLIGGEPKGGKSILVSAIIGQLHRDDPEGVVIKYNTEMREKAQVTPAQKKLWGIDPSRYVAYEVNEPALIFDPIEKEVPRLVQEGLKIRAVVIDSVNDIQGRRSMNADSVMVQQIGDEAKTLQDGFRRIKGVLRRHGVSLIMTCQIRAEMDMAEQMRGNKIRLAVPWYVKHSAEYFMLVERLRTKAGRTDLEGNEFIDDSTKVDMSGQNKGEGDESAHKIRVTMKDSSLGRPGRQGIFTLDHDKGIVNKHEEVFLLGTGTHVIDTEKQGQFKWGGRQWTGKASMLAAIRDEKDVYDGILRDCKLIDMNRRKDDFKSETPAEE